MTKRTADTSKRKGATAAHTPGRFAYEELDRVLHERARLGILTALVAQPDGVTFNDLKQLCSLTDGNLNRHLAVLADASLITVQKQPGGGRARTTIRLTPTGKCRFLDYVAALEAVIADAAAAQQQAGAARAQARWSTAQG